MTHLTSEGPIAAFVSALVLCYRVNRTGSSWWRAATRLVVCGRILLFPAQMAELARARYFVGLDAPERPHDPLVFFSRTRYLTRSTGSRQRLAAYLSHRRFERRVRTPVYAADVYRGGGIDLWEQRDGDVELSIRLEQSVEIDRNEGELSVVLRVDGVPCCIASFSYVPAGWFDDHGADEPSATVSLFLTRLQSIPGPGLARFTTSLPNESAQMYTLAATSGIALADGFRRVRAIDEREQIAYRPSLHRGFERSYSALWARMPDAGRSPDGSAHFAATFPATGDAVVRASNRSRAHRRRQTWATIRESARSALVEYRVEDPSVPT